MSKRFLHRKVEIMRFSRLRTPIIGPTKPMKPYKRFEDYFARIPKVDYVNSRCTTLDIYTF